MSDFQESSTFIRCLGSFSVSTEAVTETSLAADGLGNIYPLDFSSPLFHQPDDQTSFKYFKYPDIHCANRVNKNLLFFYFIIFFPSSEISECRPVKSVNLRVHRQQPNIKQNVHIHVPTLDVNEPAEWICRGETQVRLCHFPHLPPF